MNSDYQNFKISTGSWNHFFLKKWFFLLEAWYWTSITLNLTHFAIVPEQHSFVFYKLWPLLPKSHENALCEIFHASIYSWVLSESHFDRQHESNEISFMIFQFWNSDHVVLQDADFFIISGVALSIYIQRKKDPSWGDTLSPSSGNIIQYNWYFLQ